jgi:hypothetical protein
MVLILAKNIFNHGSITANGGDGADGTNLGPTGGGGGGGGGCIVVIYRTLSGNGVIAANGGLGGLGGAGSGYDGSDGYDGNLILLQN